MLEARFLLGFLCSILVFVSTVASSPAVAAASSEPVEISYQKDGKIQYVVGKICIARPPNEVWPILANPFEFEQKISPRFRTVEILTDTPDLSVVKVKVDVGFLLPPIYYTAHSRYEYPRRIVFHSLAGDIKDFRGTWELAPIEGGKKTLVTYAMFVQPNLPVPQWLVRQMVKMELPHTLLALRDRVNAIAAHKDSRVEQHLASTDGVRLN